MDEQTTQVRQKLRNNPKDATMREVGTLLLYYGFQKARIQRSHHIFEYDDGEKFLQIVVPFHGKKVKPIYMRRAVDILDEVLKNTETSEATDNVETDEKNSND